MVAMVLIPAMVMAMVASSSSSSSHMDSMDMVGAWELIKSA